MRILKEIEIEGKKAKALFDTGAVHTWVIKKLLKNVPTKKISKSYRVGLGGKNVEVKEMCLINGKIEGLDFSTSAISVDEIGKINGDKIDVLVGALTLEEWEITLNPKEGTLGLDGLKRREFTEFSEVQCWAF